MKKLQFKVSANFVKKKYCRKHGSLEAKFAKLKGKIKNQQNTKKTGPKNKLNMSLNPHGLLAENRSKKDCV